MSTKISGSKYAAMYGPTTGDKVRLADTSLVIEVEKDYTTYGDEVKFGGGKTIRDGMGQSVKTCSKDGDLDLVITNALIVDSTGIIKADIGIKDGKIAGIGKAGNPDIMDGVTPGMTVGASTEALAGEGMIVTAGGIDTHIHFISPQQIDCALYSGVTTMIGGGTGPADGTNATTCTPGPWNLKMMLKAAEEYPMNLGFLGKGNCSDEAPLIEQVKAGAMGLKIHEDWGATPAVINHCLNVADEYDVLYAGRMQSGRYSFGDGDEMSVIASVVLGGASMAGGSGSMIGALAGSILMGMISNALILANLSSAQQKMVNGFIIIAAVALSNLAQRKKSN